MESHLLQMRGLKPCGWCVNCRQNRSHLLQMRGLKLVCDHTVKEINVASFTDAWIETLISLSCRSLRSRIFYRCVD